MGGKGGGGGGSGRRKKKKGISHLVRLSREVGDTERPRRQPEERTTQASQREKSEREREPWDGR